MELTCYKSGDVPNPQTYSSVSAVSKVTESICRRSLVTQPTKHFTPNLGIQSVEDEIGTLATTCHKHLSRHSSDSCHLVNAWKNWPQKTVKEMAAWPFTRKWERRITNTDRGSAIAGCLLPSFWPPLIFYGYLTLPAEYNLGKVK
jgi:hypothetical protein